MNVSAENMEYRLVLLDRRAQLVANGRARLVEIPWIYEVIRFEGVVRTREYPTHLDKIQLAKGRIFITRPPCVGS
jgi:hypothetical protein